MSKNKKFKGYKKILGGNGTRAVHIIDSKVRLWQNIKEDSKGNTPIYTAVSLLRIIHNLQAATAQEKTSRHGWFNRAYKYQDQGFKIQYNIQGTSKNSPTLI
ncbi:hypothetical protein [Marinibactrum halimedae]|uniref:Uncharacterized protein n=1 Tax=Marinibactrum halimedae TaxID=1444977 RepID=A0AA37TDN0_9GAMM|nr:hypothetical protein [Marinibactrum halimedae]MCD9460547.1 hypothetical protein [Marinibactrum halimedae]GLS27910.1 hypothetical protein GCM10007877_36290 [Marinibactrum halimedae]